MTLAQFSPVEYSGEHIAYEIGMFLCARKLYFFCKQYGFAVREPCPMHPQQQAWVLEMGLLETILHHGRVLVNFLYDDTRKNKDDVIASDFFDSPDDWQTVRRPITPGLEDFRKRVNKEAAHMTTARIAGVPPEKSYDDFEFQKLIDVIRVFVESASPSRLHPNVRLALAT